MMQLARAMQLRQLWRGLQCVVSVYLATAFSEPPTPLAVVSNYLGATLL